MPVDSPFSPRRFLALDVTVAIAILGAMELVNYFKKWLRYNLWILIIKSMPHRSTAPNPNDTYVKPRPLLAVM